MNAIDIRLKALQKYYMLSEGLCFPFELEREQLSNKIKKNGGESRALKKKKKSRVTKDKKKRKNNQYFFGFMIASCKWLYNSTHQIYMYFLPNLSYKIFQYLLYNIYNSWNTFNFTPNFTIY